MNKMSKKNKIIFGVVGGVLAAVIIAVSVLAIVIFTRKPSRVDLDNTPIPVNMTDMTYYVGTEGALPDTTGLKVETVEGAVNVQTYDELFASLAAGKDVCVHAKDLVMTAELGTINLTSDIYGNGVNIDAYAVANGTLKKGGNTAIQVSAGQDVLIRDLRIFGKEIKDGDTLRTFNNYGSMINITSDKVESKAKATISHCVLDNSHKIIHMENAIVNLDGTVVRNASDTAISIGTYANRASTLNSRNNVIINSMTAGIVMYNIDKKMNDSHDNDTTWNVVNIDGFLDVYNWKSASNIAFIPDTELSGNVGLVSSVNNIVTGEISKPEFSNLCVDDAKAKFGPKADKYVHLAILKISTTYYTNKSVVNFNTEGGIGYSENVFPIPTGAKTVMKYVMMYGYFNNNDGAVKVISNFADKSNKNIFSELKFGRK